MLCFKPVGWEPAESILNEYTLEMLSLIRYLLVAVTAPYLNVIVALVIPGAVACILYLRDLDSMRQSSMHESNLLSIT